MEEDLGPILLVSRAEVMVCGVSVSMAEMTSGSSLEPNDSREQELGYI